MIITFFWMFAVCMQLGIFYKLDNAFYKEMTYFIIVGIITFIYLKIVIKDKNRTDLGKEEYSKWLAHKRFLNDFSKFDDKNLPDIILWEKYLVTATVLGCANKVEKKLKMHINDFNEIDSNLLLTTSRDINLTKTISSAVNKAISSSQIATNASDGYHSSSGSGFGGGSSGGGGGRRWRRRRWSFLNYNILKM